jgi:predicted cupin superfamily sugar epimerase
MNSVKLPISQRTAADVITALGLEPLEFEGGYFRQTYKCPNSAPASTFNIKSASSRSFSTAIYYLVTPENFSALHIVKSDEVFHYYAGDPVEMVQITQAGLISRHLIGSDIFADQSPQVVVPRGVWQGLRLVQGGKWCLMGTTVSPGFEYEDFELADRTVLTSVYPTHAVAIKELTRG